MPWVCCNDQRQAFGRCFDVFLVVHGEQWKHYSIRVWALAFSLCLIRGDPCKIDSTHNMSIFNLQGFIIWWLRSYPSPQGLPVTNESLQFGIPEPRGPWEVRGRWRRPGASDWNLAGEDLLLKQHLGPGWSWLVNLPIYPRPNNRMIPLVFPKVPQSALGILRVPQLHPPLEKSPLKNPTA